MQYKIAFSLVLSSLALHQQAQGQPYKPKSTILVYPAAARVDGPVGRSADSIKVVPSPATTQIAAKPAIPVAAPTPTVAPAAVASKPAEPATQPVSQSLLASNYAAGGSAYGRVPLAGEKSYFGEKNDYVNEFTRKYLELHNKTLGSVKDNSTKPFNVIDNVLEQKSLPKELKYLAVIESALNHKAVSRAGAVGPWQLMESTARMMGLTVNRRRDDRTDWYKSTTAATKYLELLYGQLNDWLLVIAAYNSGPTPVQRAIDMTGSRSFWDIKEYLPRETQGHVLAFIATASIFENLSKFINLGSIPGDFKFGKEDEPALPKGVAAKPGTALAAAMVNPAKAPAANGATPVAGTTSPATTVVKKATSFTDEELAQMTIVRITEPVNFEIMNLEIGIDKKLLSRWNSDYELFVNKTYPTPHYNLRIPKDKLDAYLAKKDVIAKRSRLAFASK